MSTQPTRISLARIRELQVTISWQEAVSVARAAEEAALATGHGASLETCHVTRSGTVEIVGGTRQNSSLRNPVYPLLAMLIEGTPAPDALRALVASQKPESNDVLLDFLSEDEPQPDEDPLCDLSFFARPNPEMLIAALASRGLAADADDRARRAVEALRVEVIEPPPPATPQFREWRLALPALGDWARRPKPLALGAAFAVIVAGTAWLVSSRPVSGTTMEAAEAAPSEAIAPASEEKATRSAEASVPSRPAREPAKGARSGRSDRRQASRTAAPPARESATPIAAAPSGATAAKHPDPPSPPSPTEAMREAPIAIVHPLMSPPARIPAPPSAAPDVPVAAPAPTASASEEVATENLARTIYSAEDRDVLPPVLLRPQIASEARIDTEPSNAEIELVVNAEGIVTQVRLRTNGELSLNDRMLVAAAKAWQFRPATKDGRPVSYTLRIPVTP